MGSRLGTHGGGRLIASSCDRDGRCSRGADCAFAVGGMPGSMLPGQVWDRGIRMASRWVVRSIFGVIGGLQRIARGGRGTRRNGRHKHSRTTVAIVYGRDDDPPGWHLCDPGTGPPGAAVVRVVLADAERHDSGPDAPVRVGCVLELHPELRRGLDVARASRRPS